MQRLKLELTPGRKAYFASDFHLGAPDPGSSLTREKKLVRWLDSIRTDCQYLFLLGDVFDFWFDYRHVAPRGHLRFLGKLTEMADSGIQIFMFSGNHDMWMFGYLEEELGAPFYREPLDLDWGGHRMLVGHGDGLGPGDTRYKMLKKVFSSRICQRLFASLHPWIGMGIARAWSRRSRISSHRDDLFLGDREYLWTYCREVEEKSHYDYYLFGHRHLPLDLPVGNNSRYLNLGEWLNHCLFGEYDGQSLQIREWND